MIQSQTISFDMNSKKINLQPHNYTNFSTFQAKKKFSTTFLYRVIKNTE